MKRLILIIALLIQLNGAISQEYRDYYYPQTIWYGSICMNSTIKMWNGIWTSTNDTIIISKDSITHIAKLSYMVKSDIIMKIPRQRITFGRKSEFSSQMAESTLLILNNRKYKFKKQ